MEKKSISQWRNNPVPCLSVSGDIGSIKYCIYIIKENRTYDQIFGDMAPRKGNGAPHLCLFPENVTPNHHKLADTFGLFDNFYVESEVAQMVMNGQLPPTPPTMWKSFGHSTTGAARKRRSATLQKGPTLRLPPRFGGYIWDRRYGSKGVSYRSYGEFVVNGLTASMPATTKFKNLEGHFDPMYRSFDMDYTDQKRADRFISELQRMEKEGEMPRFQVVRLPVLITILGQYESASPPSAQV